MPPHRRPRGRQQRPPGHWNVYRPRYDASTYVPTPHYDPAGDQVLSPRRVSFSSEITVIGAANNRLNDDSNPNTIPIVRRQQPFTPASNHFDPYRAPQLWDEELESLMGRTTRAYDLVINYARDCPEGQRWQADGIAAVHEAGRELHNEIRILRYWQRDADRYGTPNAEAMKNIEDDAEKVRLLCEHVQKVIKDNEYEVRSRLIAMGLYGIDEKGGLFVKEDEEEVVEHKENEWVVKGAAEERTGKNWD